MNVVGFFRDEAGVLSPFWRFAFIVIIFLVVWPPIGGSAGWWTKYHPGSPFLGWIAAAAIYSYVFCAPSALLAGIVRAVAAISFRYNSMLVSLVATVVSIIPNLALILLIEDRPARYLVSVPMEDYFVWLVASLAGSLICWFLTQRFARAA